MFWVNFSKMVNEFDLDLAESLVCCTVFNVSRRILWSIPLSVGEQPRTLLASEGKGLYLPPKGWKWCVVTIKCKKTVGQ